MSDRIITCTIEDDGSVTADAAGYHGKGCEAAIAALLAVLGGETIVKGHKPEYHQNVTNATKLKAGR